MQGHLQKVRQSGPVLCTYTILGEQGLSTGTAEKATEQGGLQEISCAAACHQEAN